MKVYPFLVGDFDVTEKVVFRNGDFKETVPFASYAFYIEDEDERILVDTGFGDPGFCKAHLHREVRTLKGMSLTEHLERHGLSPADITTVVLTHCHWDHIGALGAFKNAAVYCQSDEIPWVIAPPDYLTESYAPSFSRFIIEAKDRMVLIDGDYALRKGIFLKKSVGHSPGSQIVELIGQKKDIIIASDSLYYFDNLEKDTLNGESFCLIETINTFRYFRNRIVRKPGTIVLPGHDPKLWAMYGDGLDI